MRFKISVLQLLPLLQNWSSLDLRTPKLLEQPGILPCLQNLTTFIDCPIFSLQLADDVRKEAAYIDCETVISYFNFYSKIIVWIKLCVLSGLLLELPVESVREFVSFHCRTKVSFLSPSNKNFDLFISRFCIFYSFTRKKA